MNGVTVRLRDAATAFKDLRTLLDDEEELDPVLKWLTETARRTIPAADAVSVTVLVDQEQSAWTSTATDATVLAIDEIQCAAGHGPYLDAARTRRPVRAGVEDARVRWSAFAAAADKAGLRSYLSAPLVLDDEPVLGAMNLYGHAADAFDQLDEALLGMLAAGASTAIVNARRHRRVRAQAEQRRVAMDSRAAIEQAKGVLMAQHAITADEAFRRLVHISQDTNVKVRDVARSLLDELGGSSS